MTIGIVVAISLLWFCLWAVSYPQSAFAEFGFIASQPSIASSLSALFLHQGLFYLLPNAMFLFIFGKQVEDVFGHLFLLGVFFVSGLAGAGLFYVLNRAVTHPCTGSNGAVAGIVGAFLFLFPNSIFDVQVHLGWWHVTTFKSNTWVACAAWLFWQLLAGFVGGQVSGNFILWSNIGGFGVGLMMALLLKPFLQRQLRDKPRNRNPANSMTTLGL